MAGPIDIFVYINGCPTGFQRFPCTFYAVICLIVDCVLVVLRISLVGVEQIKEEIYFWQDSLFLADVCGGYCPFMGLILVITFTNQSYIYLPADHKNVKTEFEVVKLIL